MTCFLVYIIINRSDFVLDRGVDGSGIQFILIVLVIVCPFERKSPACALLVALNPPSVKYGEVHDAVHGSLFS